MGVWVVFGLHVLVLCAAGVLWFVQPTVAPGFEIGPWDRAALAASAAVGALVHLWLLLRRHGVVTPARLTLPLLLPALVGVGVGLVPLQAFAETISEDPANQALRALILWAGGAESAARIGLGAWASGVMLLAASVGAAALMVSRGWVVLPRSVLQRLALAIALVVGSTIVRFSTSQTLLPSDLITWGGLLAAVALLLLGARSGPGMRPGWQSTLVQSLGVMLPLGSLLALGGWRVLREGRLVNLAVDAGAFDRLAALEGPAKTADLAVAALVLAASVMASWTLLAGPARRDRRGELPLLCAALIWMLYVGSLSYVRATRARHLVQQAEPLFAHPGLQLPEVSTDADVWVQHGPTVIVPLNQPPRLLPFADEGEPLELSSVTIADVPSSHPAPPLPHWPDRNKEGGCVLGRELPGIAMPSARLVTDQRLTLQAFAAHLAPLSTREPRLFALVALREGANQADALPEPWDRVARLASSVSIPLRVESSAARAVRNLGSEAPSRFVATPERNGLRVVSLPGTKPVVDKLLVPGTDEEIGFCGLSAGCNARPCEYVIGAPPGWTMDRVMELVGMVVRAHGPVIVPAYRGHNVITLTPDLHGVRSLLRDAQGKHDAAKERER